MSDNSASFDLLAPETNKLIPTEDFKTHALALRRKFEAHAFRQLCLTAIANGIISSQNLIKAVGDVIPRKPKDLKTQWAIPNPAKCRQIINLLANLDTENIKA